ncbi:hypothetical protein F7725_009436 [Dissostichus mawsoni]|uniref:C-type lectin domain-containing protein n=1 Tax=Dissostichus mawsoni TaxID=36200 RepID=A0A7J5XNK8_DISMA|nr:hypothetical protein F7725_009436 [Dissostichus mawsoni]
MSAVSSFVDRQYYFVDEMKNMTEAQSYCREKYTDLATVHSMEVVKLLNDSFGSNTSKAWIGLYDDRDTWSWSLSNTGFNNFAPSNSDRREHCTLNSSERVPAWEPARVSLYRDPWKWSDGFRSSFRYWARSHPHSENCVAALPKGGIWVSQSCKSKIPFICYKRKCGYFKASDKAEVEKNSNLNLNDKAVQKEIIVQGLDDNVELMWRTQQDGQVFHKEDEF